MLIQTCIRNRSLHLFFILLAILMWCAAPSLAVYEVPVYSPGLERFTIGVAPFIDTNKSTLEKSLPGEMRDVLTGDLLLSGYFEIIDSTLHLEKPGAGLKLGEFDFEDWKMLRADSLVKSGFTLEGDTLTLEMRYYDVFGRRQLLGKRYTGKKEDYPDMIHRFANEIIYLLTGEQGIFGTRIAFVSKRSGTKEIYSVDLAGKNLRKVTTRRSISLSPAWSPDGKWLTYSSYVNDQVVLFKTSTSSGKGQIISRQPGINLGADWNPRGGSMALALSRDGNTEIYRISDSGKIKERITRNWSIDVSPSWSPDGTKIAFTSDRTGTPQIYVMDAGGENQRRLTYQGSYNVHPVWSPKGDQILFQGLEAGTYQIYMTNPEGSQVYRVSDGIGSNESPTWSPDGRAICYVSNRTGRKQLYIMTIDGNYTKQLTSGKWDDSNPAWSPRLLK